ncbi:MAG: putative membrane protein YfcA [Cyclobacteriaceae bacterium]|jgi:uncharacterized membrane protein YfcA
MIKLVKQPIQMQIELIALIFFVIAFLYASVGFGGGSSYLAVLTLILTDFHEIRTTALLLNLIVVSVGTLFFIKNHKIHFPKMWPFFALSIPLAFVGAQAKLSNSTFFLVLGVSLLLSGVFMCIQFIALRASKRSLKLTQKLGIGGSIGLLSGISGIGGGIFLSPSLNLLRWENAQIIAALSSLFILVNSLAGLTGLLISDGFAIDIEIALPLIGAVFFGGMLGSYVTNKKFNINIVRLLTVILVLYVGIRLVLLHGFEISI